MDNTSYTIRVPKRWGRIAAIVGVLALIAAPLTAAATNAFSDVPTSHTHHDDITWLKNAAVTKGCNPPANSNYCPDDDVTRAQMATFMRNLAQYMGAEDGTPAQADNATTAGNANQLGGHSPNELLVKVAAQRDSTPGGTSVVNVTSLEVNSVTLNAPVDGFFLLSGMVFINPVTDTFYHLTPLVDGTGFAENEASADLGPGDSDTLTYEFTVPVSAGTHTVTQEIDPTATASFFYNRNNLTVTFIPEGQGSVSTAAVGAESGGSPDGE